MAPQNWSLVLFGSVLTNGKMGIQFDMGWVVSKKKKVVSKNTCSSSSSSSLQQATKPIYLGVPLDTLTNAAPHFRPCLKKQSTSYHLRRISERLTTRTGEHFTNTRVYTTMVRQLVYARSLYSSPVVSMDTERLDTFNNRLA